jgi:hypothetical protein
MCVIRCFFIATGLCATETVGGILSLRDNAFQAKLARMAKTVGPSPSSVEFYAKEGDLRLGVIRFLRLMR